MRKFWGFMKTLLPNNHYSSQPVSVSFDGNKLTHPKNMANCFINHFCSVGKSLADKIDSSCSFSFRKNLLNRTKASMYFRPASAAEIFNVIFQLNSNKSCGFDGINARFVKIAAEVISPILAVLINTCFDVGIFPSCLKIARVVPIFKTGNKCKVNNYRPVSLLSVFSIGKVVHIRTIDFLNHHSIFTAAQYGIRSKFSTIHPVLDITTSCFDNIARDRYTGLILLDLAKAFDTVNHNILLKKLDHYGLKGLVNDFFVLT